MIAILSKASSHITGGNLQHFSIECEASIGGCAANSHIRQCSPTTFGLRKEEKLRQRAVNSQDAKCCPREVLLKAHGAIRRDALIAEACDGCDSSSAICIQRFLISGLGGRGLPVVKIAFARGRKSADTTILATRPLKRQANSQVAPDADVCNQRVIKCAFNDPLAELFRVKRHSRCFRTQCNAFVDGLLNCSICCFRAHCTSMQSAVERNTETTHLHGITDQLVFRATAALLTAG